MENTDIRKLIDFYGSKEAVAGKLGITIRHLDNCLRGLHVGKPLQRLIASYVQQIESIGK